MQHKRRTADLAPAQMARRSHGVVTRSELLVAGFSVEEIRQRWKRGTLIRVHRGVYRVGHTAPARREREARARADEFRRYTYADVFEDPRVMLSDLRALLRRGDASARGKDAATRVTVGRRSRR
jgi:hypothetical protein